MNPADNLIAYIERKLFTLNTGHAITAYLGRMKGYMTICQSISDEHIHTIVKAAMRESGRGWWRSTASTATPTSPISTRSSGASATPTSATT